MGRAQAVLCSWQGKSPAVIAKELGCHPQTIRERLHSFNSQGLKQGSSSRQVLPPPYEQSPSVMEGQVQRTSSSVYEPSPPEEPTRGVPHQLLYTYLHMNGEFPMAPAAMDPAIGYAVLTAIARQGQPDPTETEASWQHKGLDWLSYYYCGFSLQQLDTIGQAVTQLHLDAGIPIVTAEHLPMVVAAHPTNQDKARQASALLTQDFLQKDPPMIPLHCVIQDTAFGQLAIVPLDAFQSGWQFIKERVFVALLNVLDALPEVRSRLSRPRMDDPSGSPLTAANALRLAQWMSSPRFAAYQRAILACYAAAYMTIKAAEDLALDQHAAYQLNGKGQPTFRVTPALMGLIDRITKAVTEAAHTLPLQRTGKAIMPPEAIAGLINDMTRKADEPTS
jgi:hypothetical protein